MLCGKVAQRLKPSIFLTGEFGPIRINWDIRSCVSCYCNIRCSVVCSLYIAKLNKSGRPTMVQ